MALMEAWYPASRAESWDRVGLIAGDPSAHVTSILLAVDPVSAVVDEAIDEDASLVITHHPLYLRGTSFLPTSDPKGASITRLIKNDIALFNAHTNADVSADGVGDALAQLVGINSPSPLVPTGIDQAGRPIGHGRIGSIAPTRLGDFLDLVAERLPAGPHGIFGSGDPGEIIERVAVSGGAGDSFLEAARESGADVFLTADLRHHPASEHLEGGAPALICGSHYATEWPWLPILERKLVQAASTANVEVRVKVSTIITEPWTSHRPTLGGRK